MPDGVVSDHARVVTTRLVGEPLGPQHLDVMLEFAADERVMRTLGGVQDRDTVARRLDDSYRHWQDRGFGYWFFTDATTREFAGRGGLRRVTIDVVGDEIEVGWAVAADRWGQGIGTEIALASSGVAAALDLGTIVAFTLPHNIASRRVMEKSGFSYERPITWADMDHVLYRRSV